MKCALLRSFAVFGLALLVVGSSHAQKKKDKDKNPPKEKVKVQHTIKEHYNYDHDTLITSLDSNIFKVENLGELVNSDHVESGPRISPDGKSLYFFRIDDPKNVSHTRDIWVSHFNTKDSTWGKAEHLTEPLNNHGNNSVHFISPDGKTMLVHNKYLKNGTVENGVSMTRMEKGKWTMPEELKIKHYKNDEVCSFFMNDKMDALILCIHHKDSYGHQDMYVSFKQGDGNHWSEPLNMGPTINTPGSEATAFLAADGKTMYFSSNGRLGGVGGFDIYKTTRLDSTWTNWSKPENMGIPYNTKDDEFYFTIPAKGDYVYLSHHFKTKDKFEHSDIVRIKLQEEKKPDPVLVLTGNVFDDFSKEEIPGVVRFREKGTAKIIETFNCVPEQGYHITLPKGKVYEWIADADGYAQQMGEVSTVGLKEYEEREQNIYMKKGAGLLLTGLIKDEDTKEPLRGHIVFTRLSDGKEIANIRVTPDTPYEIFLPAGEKYEYKVNADKDYRPNYLGTKKSLDLTALDEYKEEKKDIFLQKLVAGSHFVINDIYFEYNRATLLPKSFVELDNLAEILKDYPYIKVEIGGHTDSDGSDAYNLKLSGQRAASVVKYLSDAGIAKDALLSKGYGEREPIASNKTSEGKQLNRRVEFKILDVNQ